MGYGIMLSLDDVAVRADRYSSDDLAGHLREVLGSSSYPVGGGEALVSGPWQSAGAYHSHDLVVLHLDAEHIGPADIEAVVDDPVSGIWQAALRPRDHHRALRDLRRHPARMARIAGAPDPMAAVFGPDHSGRSLRSAWWFYADAVGHLPDSAGAEIRAMVDSRDRVAVSAGSFANALNKLGALLVPTTVELVWSGNRLCTPAELTGAERLRYEQRLARR